MSILDSNKGSMGRDPQEGAGGALLFFAGIGLLIFFVSSAAAVFAASLAAGAAIVLAMSVTFLLAALLYRQQRRVSVSLILLAASALWAASLGAIVFKYHWLAFTPAAWVLSGLVVAALVSGAWSLLNTFLKMIAALFALSLVAATMVLPRPPGGDGPLDTAEEWEIDVEVKDDHGEPLEGALVLCGAVMTWERKLGLAETFARETDRDGRIPTWEFKEDPRLKIVICQVWKDANDGNAGYPPASQLVYSLAGGGKYKLDYALVENPHPDRAFLALDVSGDYQQAWYTLQFELWAGQPVGYFGSREGGAAPLLKKSWNELRGNGFTIPAASAEQDLHLRYHYEGPGGEGLVPPYNEFRTVQLGAIDAGTRKRLSLRIPSR